MNRFYEVAEIAKERPLVVLFAFERTPLLKIILPRLVNAVRHIGGYLVVIDDGSWDERIPMILKDYEEEGWVDLAFLGKQNRHVDWVKGIQKGHGKRTARRSAILHLLSQRGVPMVICCDADIIMPPNALEVLLIGSRIAREEGLPASHFCGFRYNKTTLSHPDRRSIRGYTYVMFMGNTSMALSLVPLDMMRRVNREGPPWHDGKWSLNEYADRAFRMAGLHSCYILNVPCQHLGVGHVGRTFCSEIAMGIEEIAAFEDDGSLQQIEGFDFNTFYNIAHKGTYLTLERLAYLDKHKIHDKGPVHPEFYRLKELIT